MGSWFILRTWLDWTSWEREISGSQVKYLNIVASAIGSINFPMGPFRIAVRNQLALAGPTNQRARWLRNWAFNRSHYSTRTAGLGPNGKNRWPADRRIKKYLSYAVPDLSDSSDGLTPLALVGHTFGWVIADGPDRILCKLLALGRTIRSWAGPETTWMLLVSAMH